MERDQTGRAWIEQALAPLDLPVRAFFLENWGSAPIQW